MILTTVTYMYMYILSALGLLPATSSHVHTILETYDNMILKSLFTMHIPPIYINMLLVVNIRVIMSTYVAFHVDINGYNVDGGAVG